ncbi:MAG: phosphatidylserine decarboxylase [Deltaproteobacteria bacterium]|nr:phosphatidylserine decarboxylase [Deltaproteobacteria bacterium]
MNKRMHQYIERETAEVRTERLFADKIINFIYSYMREDASTLFKALASARMSRLLGYVNYDSITMARLAGAKRFVEMSGVDLSECVDDPGSFKSLRDVFERKIRFWETRPMPDDDRAVVSPADAKILVGSFSETSRLFLKDKFFEYEELLGETINTWHNAFHGGNFAVLRLTPEKYHYNHVPVTGTVVDIYELPGSYHPCNPAVVVNIATPCSKNKRVVTIIDTDVEGGTGIGLVAMIEIVALMIGDIVQCYSAVRYENPVAVYKGVFLLKGQPKSLYRPGSSTDVLLFQKNRISFSDDLVRNMYRPGVHTRFARGFVRPLVETEVSVRARIGNKKDISNKGTIENG